MKKLLILIGILISISIEHSEAKEDVPMTIFTKGHPVKNTTVKRAPIQINVDVYYNASERTVSIESGEDVEAQVYITSSYGEIFAFSSQLNSTLSIPSDYTGILGISIETATWSAEGELEI